MGRDRERFENPQTMAAVYGEPCDACDLWESGSWCVREHRQKRVVIETGHIPELTVRRRGGCPDHKPKAGLWWHEDPPSGGNAGYGGTSTNLLRPF